MGNMKNAGKRAHIECRKKITNALYIQGVTGGKDQTSGECSLGQTIPI